MTLASVFFLHRPGLVFHRGVCYNEENEKDTDGSVCHEKHPHNRYAKGAV